MILQAIEEAWQAQCYKSEPILTFDLAKLQIEHIMPQNWQEHWPLPENDTTKEARTGQWTLSVILTLVSDRLNPSLSNGPWSGPSGACKRDGLADHSKLELNRRLLAGKSSGVRRGSAIRAEELFDEAKLIWPPSPTVPLTIA